MITHLRPRRNMLACVVLVSTLCSLVPLDAPVAAAAQPAGAVAPGTPPPFEVTLTANGFVPDLITVVPGQSIVFANDSGAPRRISSEADATFDSGAVAAGSRYVLAFPTAGTWRAIDDASTPHTATITVGQQTLPGGPFDSANLALPDAMAPDAPVISHPAFGILVTRNRILVSFTASATVPQANAALAAAGLTIVGGNRDLSLLVTEVADAGTASLDYMQTALDTLRAQPGVRTAAYDISINPEAALPRPVVPDPGAIAGKEPYSFDPLVAPDDSIRGDGSNFGLEAARFPQAWNWLDAIRSRAPGNATTSSTIVLDNGFDTTHPDLAHATLHRLCTADGRCTENHLGTDEAGDVRTEHGTATAGIVGAEFDRGSAVSRTSQGTVGGDPTSSLHLVPFFFDDVNDSRNTVMFVSFLTVLDLILDEKGRAPFAFPNLRVINLSAGSVFLQNEDGVPIFQVLYGEDTCGPGADDDVTAPAAERVFCTPNNKDSYLKEFRANAELVRPLASRLAANNVLLVVAAANDGTSFCLDRPQPLDPEKCVNFATISTANINPFGFLESIWPASSVPPWVLVEANETTVTSMERTRYSNDHGTISAAGRALVPFVNENSVPTYHELNGTSMAAPLVTAAAGLLSALTPSWTTVRKLLVERGPTDLKNSSTPRLDVFSSLIGLPNDVGLDALLDVNDTSPDGNRRVTRDDRNQPTGEDRELGSTQLRTDWSAPDGAIDMRDFRRYRDAWLAFCSTGVSCPAPGQVSLDGSATHPKKDMNLDGCVAGEFAACDTTEGAYSRVDFNGDGTLLDRAFPILLDANGNPTDRGAGTRMTDLDVLQTRFGTGSNPNTEGWTAADLDALMVSADVELRLDTLWAGGVDSAEVTVSTVDTAGPRRTLTSPGIGTGDVRIYSVPIDPLAEVGNTDLIQVRVVGHLPGDTTVTYLSPPLDVKAGQDIVVVPCTSQLILTSSPAEVAPGGSATVTATLSDCTGRPVASSPIDFEIAAGPNGSGLSAVSVLTDSQGIARTTFTYPDGVNSDAQVVARAFPALDGGERLERFVDIGPAADVVIHYRFRQTILDYQRTSTNYWGTGQDDCVGGASGSVKCFTATQEIDTRFDLPILQFDLTLGELERTGTITPSGDGGATIDESVRTLQRETSTNPDAFDLTGINLTTTVQEWDPATPDVRTTKIYDSPIRVAGQPSATEYADLPPLDVPTIDFGITDDALLVNNLKAYGDGYALAQAAYTLQRGFTILPEDTNPDLPIPNLYQPLQQIPTDLALVPRVDSSSFAWGWNPDAPLEFVGNGDGTYKPVSWCGTRERLFDNADDPGYWNDTDPAIDTINALDPNEIFHGPYRDPDAQRAERQTGDRAAPQHTGSVTSRFEFVAVVTKAGDPVPALDFGTCTETQPDPIVGWEPGEPVEGQPVNFLDLSSYADTAVGTDWRFGDPAGSSPTPTQHRFSDNGVYTVDFTVTDAAGASHISEPAAVTVKNVPPTMDVIGFSPDGRSIEVSIDDAGVIDRQQLEVRLTSPTPGWPAGGYSVYTSPPTDPITLQPALGAWTRIVDLPTTIAPGVYFVVLTVLDKDGGKATASFTLAVPQPTVVAGGGGGGPTP
ncbi:MAG: S8 family serine peptidase, partial [Ilumatobacteraceae bacterium]